MAVLLGGQELGRVEEERVAGSDGESSRKPAGAGDWRRGHPWEEEREVSGRARERRRWDSLVISNRSVGDPAGTVAEIVEALRAEKVDVRRSRDGEGVAAHRPVQVDDLVAVGRGVSSLSLQDKTETPPHLLRELKTRSELGGLGIPDRQLVLVTIECDCRITEQSAAITSPYPLITHQAQT